MKDWRLIKKYDTIGVMCPECKHKMSALSFIFADVPTTECPWCHKPLSISDEVYDTLFEEAQYEQENQDVNS